jgi:hypothetical protein
MGRLKKNSTAWWKDKAWRRFSQYVRLRDWANQLDPDPWLAPCVSCGKQYPISGVGCLQAGHFITRVRGAILFDEKNVHAQCLTEESTIDGRSIKELKTGDKISAFNETTFEPEKATVESVKSFVPDKLYKVEMEDGSVFYATRDHRVVANGQWKRIDDMLHNCTDNDILEL